MSEPSIQKILIIDDSGDYRELLTKFFDKVYPNAEVDEYDPTWGKPPDTFPWSRYNLLILDYDLGSGENGLEWLRHYKTSKEFPPTIILTAADNEELVVNAIRFGAQGFLRKEGLSKDTLIKSIESALKKYEEDQEKADTQKIHAHVYNKDKFFQSLEITKQNDAVFLIEIDKYNALSESLGIFAADQFANYILESIYNFIPDSNYDGYITRIGDSKAAMLIKNNKDEDSIEEIAKKLCNHFAGIEYKNGDKKIDFAVNIGTVCIDEKITKLEDILATVEKACRLSREKPGNAYTFESKSNSDILAADPVTADDASTNTPTANVTTSQEPSADDLDEPDEEQKSRIISALKEERIQPLFQPLVLVSEGAAHANTEFYHTRSNLLDTDNNVIEAKEFIPILKQAKLFKTLDRWAIRNCVGELSKLNKKQAEKFGVLITLSEQSINDKALSDWINKLIDYVKMPKLCESIVFEIVVEDFIAHQAQAKLQINKLRVKLGASFALRDVQDVPTLSTCLQQEKFDFVMFSPEHAGNKKMDQNDILQLIDKAKAHGALTVASKIDSGEYLAMAAGAGVDYVFGHFVQPPMENIVAAETVEV